MFETITKLAGYLENVTFLTYPITIFLGFLSGMTALMCCLPLVPAIAGFIGIQQCTRRRLFTVPFLIMLGSMVTLVALGVIVSFVGVTLQQSLGKYWSYLIGAVCIIVGLFVLGAIKIRTKINVPKIKQTGVIAPFLFGLCIGGVMGFGSACCLPALPIVLTYAAIKGRPLHGALIMSSFAIGQSIPLFAIGLFSNALGKFASKWSIYIRHIAGVVLLITGIYFIWIKGMKRSVFMLVFTVFSFFFAHTTTAGAAVDTPAWKKVEALGREGAFTFLFVGDTKTEEGKSMLATLETVKQKANDHKVGIINIMPNDPKEGNLLRFLNIKDSSTSIVIAPNGAITGGFVKTIDEKTLSECLLSLKETRLVKNLQEGRAVFLCFYSHTETNLEKIKSNIEAVTTNFKGRGEAIFVSGDEKIEEKLRENLNVSSNETAVFVLHPPKVVVTKLSGENITKENLIKALLVTIKSGCCPVGSQKKCN